jgi:hypothetical protein
MSEQMKEILAMTSWPMVVKNPLNAEVGSVDFSREERFCEATRALQGWASRLRACLDLAHELSSDDIARNKANHQPYGRDEK